MRCFTALLIVGCSIASLFAQNKKYDTRMSDADITTREIVYKTTPEGKLQLHVFYPEGWKGTDQRPVILFFFGGGWNNGSFQQFVPQAHYFASRGIVAISADYRIKSIHKTTPDKCVEDAKSAMRYVRANAKTLGIDPDKIVVSGGSAGGHIAACTALIEGFNAESDPDVSAKPAAMVLYNPVTNFELTKGRTIKDGNGNDVGKAISPSLYLDDKTPPAIIFFGTDDQLLVHGQDYMKRTKKPNVILELASGQGHGFFNRSPWLEITTQRTDKFLQRLGYLKGDSTVKIPVNSPKLSKATPEPRR